MIEQVSWQIREGMEGREGNLLRRKKGERREGRISGSEGKKIRKTMKEMKGKEKARDMKGRNEECGGRREVAE